MSDFIPLAIPCLEGKEWEYTRDCLDTGWVSSAGRYVTRFEEEIARYTGMEHAVACASGTAALHTALLIAGVRPGDEVLVPTLTFIAPINVVRYCGAEPVFIDCDGYYNLATDPVLEFLSSETVSRDGGRYNVKTGRRIAALVTVDVFGNAGKWHDLYDTCRGHGIAVIEDATEALGTRIESWPGAGQQAGAAADMCCFSFNGNKIITTGGGGMICTANARWADRARYLTQQAKDDAVAYRHDEVGYNYRMTNTAAAMGVAQLEQIESFIERKMNSYRLYGEGLQALDWCDLREVPEGARNNHWMFALHVTDGPYRGRIRELVDRLMEEKIETRPVWRLNHLQKPFADCLNTGSARAEDLVSSSLNLPCSSNLTADQIARVCEVLHRV